MLLCEAVEFNSLLAPNNVHEYFTCTASSWFDAKLDVFTPYVWSLVPELKLQHSLSWIQLYYYDCCWLYLSSPWRPQWQIPLIVTLIKVKLNCVVYLHVAAFSSLSHSKYFVYKLWTLCFPNMGIYSFFQCQKLWTKHSFWKKLVAFIKMYVY